MTASLFRAALTDVDGPALGTWVKLPAVESVELMALAGFDFVVIDLEHAPLDLETVSGFIAVALRSGLSPIVRVPGIDGGLFQRLLDAGAEGIMVPHVDSVDEAERVARLARFPPRGTRGVGATGRAGQWGALPRAEYLRFGQEEVVLIAQLESADAVDAAGDIARVDGIDAVLVGMADLSLSVQRDESDPYVRDLAMRAIAAAHETGVPVGTAGAATPAAVGASAEMGYDFLLLGNDAGFLGAAARTAVAGARAAVAG